MIAYLHNVAVYVKLARTLHTMSGLGAESWHAQWFDDGSLIPFTNRHHLRMARVQEVKLRG